MAAASTVGDTAVVWILSWGMVVVASLVALLVAYVCFSNAAEEIRATQDRWRPAAWKLVGAYELPHDPISGPG